MVLVDHAVDCYPPLDRCVRRHDYWRVMVGWCCWRDWCGRCPLSWPAYSPSTDRRAARCQRPRSRRPECRMPGRPGTAARQRRPPQTALWQLAPILGFETKRPRVMPEDFADPCGRMTWTKFSARTGQGPLTLSLTAAKTAATGCGPADAAIDWVTKYCRPATQIACSLAGSVQSAS